jgi:hypothetical protein
MMNDELPDLPEWIKKSKSPLMLILSAAVYGKMKQKMKWDERQIELIQKRYRHYNLVALAVELADQREILAELNEPDSGADFAEIIDQEHTVEALRRMLNP